MSNPLPGTSNSLPKLPLETQRDFAAQRLAGLLDRQHTLVAPAKINIRLKVLGRRVDGYHLLSLLNASTTLCDTLLVTLCREPTIDIVTEPEGSVLVPVHDNLVSKAFKAFWQAVGFEAPACGLRVVVTKRIPVGGGLGGGSSDAGAILRFLVGQFSTVLTQQCGISAAELDRAMMDAAATVGADVPYAYRGGVCWVTGVGEQVQPLVERTLWKGEVLISVPSASVPTARFYEYFRQQHPTLAAVRDEVMEEFARNVAAPLSPHLIENDFESDICSYCPAVGKALAGAREVFPGTTSITGSGAAIFSLVPPEFVGRVPEYLSQAARENITVHRTALIG